MPRSSLALACRGGRVAQIVRVAEEGVGWCAGVRENAAGGLGGLGGRGGIGRQRQAPAREI
jgi:hypothetical protein